jgi:hypothetical protein
VLKVYTKAMISIIFSEICILINLFIDVFTVHENVALSTDSFLRGESLICQKRQFSLSDKIQIKCEKFSTFSNFLGKNSSSSVESQVSTLSCWTHINESKITMLSNETSKNLIIYPYSISNNFLREVFNRMGIKCILTNDIDKASVIIGSFYSLQQNPTLNKLALKKQIPIYAFQKISFYQLAKFVRSII